MKHLYVFLLMFLLLENVSSQMTSITIPGSDITAIAVYEKSNKLFVADDDHQCIYVINCSSNQIVDTINLVGGAIFSMVVNETSGKLYAASDKDCCTTGITPGLGLVSVIDAQTHKIITQINPGSQGGVSYFYMSNDEVHDKIYLHFFSGVGVIDASSNIYTKIIQNWVNVYLDKFGINTITNEVFIPNYVSGINIINGNTLATEFVAFPNGASKALDVAVNEAQNKVYITMITIPGQAYMGICIYDRTKGTFSFIGADDLEPLAYNNLSGKLFSGVQVGKNGAIIDGSNDALTNIPLISGGIAAIDIKYSTDRAYLASCSNTLIVDGAEKRVVKNVSTGYTGSGVISTEIVINQSTGKVYVVNRGSTGIINVFQDSPTPAPAGTIKGNKLVCLGQSNVLYTVPEIANATSYIWSLPTGATGSSATNSISVNFSTIAQSGNIIVKGSNNGGEGIESILAITTNTIPTITGTTSGSRCGTGTVTLGATASAGSINWYSAPTGGTSLGTGASFTTPSQSKTTIYYVDATNNGCTTATRTAVTAKDTCTTGVNNILSFDKVNVYPNPTNGMVEITINEPVESDYTIELFNNLGSLKQKVIIDKYTKASQIDLSGYPAGLYLIRFDTNKGFFDYKILKE